MAALNICVGIPTVGRARVLSQTLAQLGRQTRAPDRVIVCGSRPIDLEGAAEALPGVHALLSPLGLPRQRNAIIAAAANSDILLFFDDDFLADPDYVAAVERHMTANPGTVVTTGVVLADGINGPGLSVEEGLAIVAAHRGQGSAARQTFAGYGCNMALRLTVMRQHRLLFDERLPMYGWQEDVDLSRQLAVFGNVVRLDGARGVHLGTKLGRGSGLRLGYSQVANPLYLAGKRCGYPLRRALTHIAGNVTMNVVRSLWPEPYVDRRGRLVGNALAIRDLLWGRMLPERILDL